MRQEESLVLVPGNGLDGRGLAEWEAVERRAAGLTEVGGRQVHCVEEGRWVLLFPWDPNIAHMLCAFAKLPGPSSAGGDQLPCSLSSHEAACKAELEPQGSSPPRHCPCDGWHLLFLGRWHTESRPLRFF